MNSMHVNYNKLAPCTVYCTGTVHAHDIISTIHAPRSVLERYNKIVKRQRAREAVATVMAAAAAQPLLASAALPLL